MRARRRAYREWMETTMLAILVGVLAGGASRAATPGPAAFLTKSELEKRVLDAASHRLGLAVTDVRILSADERTWPDRQLGCAARRGLTEPEPTPGYRFVLEADGTRESYHTDRAGRIVRCPAAGKPLGPIQH
jgi:hypothetical protein